MSGKPNASVTLTAAELVFIARHYGNRKSQAIHEGLALLVRDKAQGPRITVEDVGIWLAQSREAEAQLLRQAVTGGGVDAGELVAALHAIIDVWGAAHAQVSRTHWQQVASSGYDPVDDGPDAGDLWTEGEPEEETP